MTRFLIKRLGLGKLWKFVAIRLGLRPKSKPRDGGFQHGSAYGIDRVLFVSGFGAFVSGWLLSPRRRVRTMSLLMGGQVLEGDRRCFVTAPRPDLAGAFADYADAVSTAGFQAVFRGAARGSGGETLMLQLHLEDGGAPVVRIPDSVIRLCDGSDALPTVVRLFPGLASELFLEDFAGAFGTQARLRAADVLPIIVEPVRHVAIMVLPRQSDDLFLFLAELRRSAAMLPADVGIGLLITPQHPRARILDCVSELRLTSGRAVSVFEVGDLAYALWSVGSMLSALGADKFWFCGPEVISTRAGWQAAADYFVGGSSDLALFLRTERQSDGAEPESMSFAWSSSAFATWAEAAPFFLGGFHRDNRLPSQPAPSRTYGAIGLTRTMIGSDAIRRADERLYRSAAAKTRIEVRP